MKPCSPEEAVQRALSMRGRTERYQLGTGDYRPRGDIDLPFTAKAGKVGSDCWGFAGAWAYKLPRHRPGFNKGPWATVSDDINCDSAIEDAEHLRELYEVVSTPAKGDLLVMPSIRGPDRRRIRIGHVWLVVDVPAEWDAAAPQLDLLTTMQCQASLPPAIKHGPGPRYDGSSFRGMVDPRWRIRILRVRQ